MKNDDSKIGRLLKQAELAMVRSKNAALKPVGLTLAQYFALTELEANAGITSAELARLCMVSPQNMLVLLRSMEQQGLVDRTAHPRHANVLELNVTVVGREALAAGARALKPIHDQLAERISVKDTKQLADLLTRYAQALNE